MSAEFDFDTLIDRREVPALKMHPMVLGKDGSDLFAAGVADMDFRVAPAIVAAMRARVEHGIFGYEALPSLLMPALTDWLANRHGWHVEPGHVLRAPNVPTTVSMSERCFLSA